MTLKDLLPQQTKDETPAKEPQRALITYRTKPLEANAKWSLWFQREIAEAKDSADAMFQFYDHSTWPCMTGMIEVKGITWLGDVL